MKLKPNEVNNPPKSCRAFLIYGADGGLAKLHSQTLLKALKIDVADDFAITKLDFADVQSDPAMLHDALSAMSLMGDAPCVVVRDAGNRLTDILKDIYTASYDFNYLLVMAGELDSKSSLKALFEDEKRKNMAAIACYRVEGASLTAVIRTMLGEARINASPDVCAMLTSMLGNDRAIIQSEIDKISIYMGAERTLTPEIVQKCCADNQHLMLHQAMLELLAGNMLAFVRTTERLMQSGESMVAAMRVLQYHFTTLSGLVEKHLRSGSAPAELVKSNRPFINFTSQPLYVKAMMRWKNPSDLMRLQSKMVALEVQSKTTGVQDFMLMHEMLNIN